MVPRADYRIAARVLQSKHYDDWQAAFAPIDLALGWGKISEPQTDRWIEWRQSNRWYYYRLRRLQLFGGSLSAEYIRAHSANVHIVPATTMLASALQQLERNSFVLLEGKLVDVEARRDGPFTVFAPTDEAWAAFEATAAETDATITEILLYHVLNGAHPAAAISGPRALPTLGGEYLFFSSAGAGANASMTFPITSSEIASTSTRLPPTTISLRLRGAGSR